MGGRLVEETPSVWLAESPSSKHAQFETVNGHSRAPRTTPQHLDDLEHLLLIWSRPGSDFGPFCPVDLPNLCPGSTCDKQRTGELKSHWPGSRQRILLRHCGCGNEATTLFRLLAQSLRLRMAESRPLEGVYCFRPAPHSPRQMQPHLPAPPLPKSILVQQTPCILRFRRGQPSGATPAPKPGCREKVPPTGVRSAARMDAYPVAGGGDGSNIAPTGWSNKLLSRPIDVPREIKELPRLRWFGV